MTKADLVRAIASKAEITLAQAELALIGFSNAVISNVLDKGDSVSIPGLGTFKQAKRTARTGRNPRTGETVQIAASTKLVFHMSSSLKG